MRLKELSHGCQDAVKIDPRQIVVRENFNFRDTTSEAAQKHIAWLRESIRENGVQEPIRVEFINDTVYLVNGECRVRAALELWKEGLEIYVPAIQVKGDEAEILAKSMVANGALPPTQLEFGRAAARLEAYGWDIDRIAQYTPPHIASNPKTARKYVSDALELNSAPLEVKQAVKEGIDGVQVSPALAVQAIKKNRLLAKQQLEQQAEKAKKEGKKVAKRPKGDGKATKEKKTQATKQDQLIKLGDRMATLIMAMGESSAGPSMRGSAEAWNSLRGR